MSILDKIKNLFTKTNINTQEEKIKIELPKSPIGLQGHWTQITSLPQVSKCSVLTTKKLHLPTETLRWCRIPDKYCGNPNKCIVIFNKKSFVTTLYFQWLFKEHLETYKSVKEFQDHVTIYGAINRTNFKRMLENYYYYTH